jgi:HlyD family secretion protein
VLVQGWGGDPIPARVVEVEPSAFTRPSALGVDEQRVNVVVAFTAPRESWARLGDGYHVEARIILWRGDEVVQVPTGAVFRHGNGWAAFEHEGDEARLIPVGVGRRGEADVEITSGLDVGDSVVVYPGDRVKDGAEVEIRR